MILVSMCCAVLNTVRLSKQQHAAAESFEAVTNGGSDVHDNDDLNNDNTVLTISEEGILDGTDIASSRNSQDRIQSSV